MSRRNACLNFCAPAHHAPTPSTDAQLGLTHWVDASWFLPSTTLVMLIMRACRAQTAQHSAATRTPPRDGAGGLAMPACWPSMLPREEAPGQQPTPGTPPNAAQWGAVSHAHPQGAARCSAIQLQGNCSTAARPSRRPALACAPLPSTLCSMSTPRPRPACVRRLHVYRRQHVHTKSAVQRPVKYGSTTHPERQQLEVPILAQACTRPGRAGHSSSSSSGREEPCGGTPSTRPTITLHES